MEGIDDQGGNASRLKMRKHALPINPGALHDHMLDAMGLQPADQSAHVPLEPAERARLARHRAVLLANQDGDDMLHAMHVDAGNPLMDRFHIRPPSAKLRVREASSGLDRILCPRRLRDMGQFTVRAASSACATIWGTDWPDGYGYRSGFDRQTKNDLSLGVSRTGTLPKPKAAHAPFIIGGDGASS